MNDPRSAQSIRCEACERAPAALLDSRDDPAEPYRVCQPCHARLVARSLRPREWYNLAKRHGWQRHHLHDDFYEEDGSASQPLEEVQPDPALGCPSLAEVQSDLAALADYSITRWHLRPELREAWRGHGSGRALGVLGARFDASKNAAIRSRLLEIVAVFGSAGAPFVRTIWQCGARSISINSLAKASAVCLGDEGYERVEEWLDRNESNTQPSDVSLLSHFRSPRALDWIEVHITSPVAEAWGRLAAVSRIDWPRIDRWLMQGRPLSLVALDSLRFLIQPDTLILRDVGELSLGDPPSPAHFREVLEAYARRDPVPRVETRVASLLQQAERIVGVS